MAASTTEGKIIDALFGKLAALTLSPALPVAYPDKAFTKPASGAWLEAFIFRNPNQTVALADDGTDILPGLFQITICAPEGLGVVNSQDIAGAIVAHFARGTKMVSGGVSVRSTKRPDVAPSYADHPYTRTPVTITFEVLASQ